MPLSHLIAPISCREVSKTGIDQKTNCEISISPILTLSADSFEEIVNRLDANDSFKLLMCGNSRLSFIVAHALRQFETHSTTRPIFPFSAFELPKLRSLRVKATYQSTSYLDLTQRDFSHPSVRNASVEEISFAFRQSGKLLLDCLPSSGHLNSLSERFPSLTCLKLTQLWSSEGILRALEFLPSILTSLTLKMGAKHPHQKGNALTWNIIAKLPRSLTDLRLEWRNIVLPGSTELISASLPPQLRILELSLLNSYSILNVLPTTLEIGRFAIINETKFVWKISCLPPALVEMFVDASRPISVVADSDWPENLQKCNFCCEPPMLAELLPKNLTELPTDVEEDLQVQGPSCFASKFPNLKFLSLTSEIDIFGGEKEENEISEISDLPKSLVSLQVTDSIRLKYLPDTLKRLFLDDLHCEDVKELPEFLSTLCVVPSGKKRIFREPVSIDHLPMHLTCLYIPLRIFDVSIEAMDTNLKFLKRLYRLRVLHLEDLPCGEELSSDSSNFLVDCLPSSLEKLKFGDVAFSEMSNPIGHSWIRRIDMATNLPNLRTLDVDCTIYTQQEPLGPTLASLPKSLREIRFRFFDFFEHDALSFLPKNLSIIRLDFYLYSSYFLGASMADAISDKHFENLPPSLTSLRIQLPAENTVTSKITSILPPYLTQIDLGDTAQAKEIRSSVEMHIASQPHMRGY